MAMFSTEQTLPFTFEVKDGRGRNLAVDGKPDVASSDETIATVAIEKGTKNTWNGVVTPVSPSPNGTTQRITVSADADLGEGLQTVTGFFDFTVTLDERSAARIVELTPGQPVDKEV